MTVTKKIRMQETGGGANIEAMGYGRMKVKIRIVCVTLGTECNLMVG